MHLHDFKIISAVATLAVTYIGCAGPLWIKNISWSSRLEAMAGGVFIGAGLAHLLSDATDELTIDAIHTSYPVGSAMCIVTFVLFTGIEMFSHSKKAEDENNCCCNEQEENADQNEYETVTDEDTENINSAEKSKESTFGNDNTGIKLPIITLLVMMCVHSVIEGLALGILRKWSGVIAIFCAIVGHKPIEAFAVALVVYKCRPTCLTYWLLISVFAFASPIGIIIGIFLNSIHSPLLIGLITAFSAGTFLFVGSAEWSEMYAKRATWDLKEKGWHFGMYAFGAIWMLIIAIIEAVSSGV